MKQTETKPIKGIQTDMKPIKYIQTEIHRDMQTETKPIPEYMYISV